MINKVHFGKMISALRRNNGLSQAELAVKLGVTSQAVSKWECGNSIPYIDLLLDLSRLYNVTINEMLKDADLLYSLTGMKTEPNGIVYFVPKHECDYTSSGQKKSKAGAGSAATGKNHGRTIP